MGRASNWGFLILVLGLILLLEGNASETDTMAVGDSLTGTQNLTSGNGTFRLGFFNLNGTGNWYVGIWYARLPEFTVAWIANRENPIKNNSGTLNLLEDGRLVLSYGQAIIWSTNVTQKASSAVLTDGGNLVVHGAANRSEVIWQSFDNPGNTWLPGMKISVSQRLSAWKSPWDPTPGVYNLQMDPSANQFVLIWRNTNTYWESGHWDGNIFSKVPEMTQNYIYEFSFFDNGTYKYFTYSVKPSFASVSRFVMTESGDIKVSIWLPEQNQWSMFWSQPRDQCQVYALCGAYGSCNQNNVQFCRCVQGFEPTNEQAWDSQEWSDGCARSTALDCGGNRTSTDGFMELTGESTPAGGVDVTAASADGCKAACSGNCSCTAYAYVTGACQLWFGDLINLVDKSSGANSLFVRLAAGDVPKTGGGKSTATVAGVAAGAAAAVAAVLAVGGVFLVCWRRQRGALHYAAGSLAVFSYRELQVATKNFSERLGGGGFGSVFKGTLADKTQVAVKKLEGLSQGEKQFRMEVSTIGTIQHVNLVRLRGFCSEGSSRLLVYEYMPNGSLNNFLFHKDGSGGGSALDWKSRFGIALGTARGILYLHEKCRDCIIHCDIKPENILLDSDFCPKVADFGLAKLVGREFSHVLTTMRGTRGYLAPEWISGLPITTKADVYSFGMTLIEIISGRRNMDSEPGGSELFFPTWAATQINSGNAMALLDKRLNGNADSEQLRRAAMVGGWCIQDDEDDRPSMNQVVQILEGIGDVHVPPVPMSLQALVAKADSLVFYWDKEAAPRTNTSSSGGSNPSNSSKTSKNLSNSMTSVESSPSLCRPE
uniref:Receptor-like serine/threonine-protein kinase n=1 Tax=Araucaria cunninghamii TaxID=56994 RepID=A0A0D6QT17_ARACU